MKPIFSSTCLRKVRGKVWGQVLGQVLLSRTGLQISFASLFLLLLSSGGAYAPTAAAQNQQQQTSPSAQQTPNQQQDQTPPDAGGPGGDNGAIAIPKKPEKEEEPPPPPPPEPKVKNPKGLENYSLRVDVPVVNVDVGVILQKTHQFVPNLQEANFRVWEDGVPQKIVSFQRTKTSITAVLLCEFASTNYWFIYDMRNAAYCFRTTVAAGRLRRGCDIRHAHADPHRFHPGQAPGL